MSNIPDQLFHAAWNGQLQDIESLLALEKASLHGHRGRALEAAAYNAQPEACDLLLQLGADPNTFHEPTGETVLHQVITKTTSVPERTWIVKS